MNKVRGYITVRVSGGSPERFFNLCSFHGMILEEVKQEPGGFSFRMDADRFFEAGRLSKKAGTKLRIVKKRGLPFFLMRSRKRLAFYVGILLCLGFLYGSSLFIWDIHLEGNTKYTDSAMLHFLEEKGYRHGMKKAGIVCEEIEKEIRGRYNDITWVSAEITGNRLIIRIKENQVLNPAESSDGNRKKLPAADDGSVADTGRGPSLFEDTEGRNITAKKSGTVRSVITRSGTPLVHAGDTVEAGQVLISGTLEINDESGTLLYTEQVEADGDILAETVYPYEDRFLLEAAEKHYTGQERKRSYLWLFGKRFFFPGKKNRYERYDEVDSYQTLHLWENFYLPFGFGSVTAREYLDGTRVYSEQEAKTLAEESFSAFCERLTEEGAVLQDTVFRTEVSGGECKAEGKVVVVESIGVETEIPEEFAGGY